MPSYLFLINYEVYLDMSNLKNIANTAIDNTTEFFEKVSTPASRAGSVVERVGTLLEEGVDKDVIALQMTKNSPNRKKYTGAKVLALGELFEDSKTKVTITSAQSRALINDQRKNNQNLGDSIPQG